MTVEPAPQNFFVAGGTVPPGSPSYVERAADWELLEALLAGEFCYVLNARQMGKSSLAVRTIAKLADAGVRTAFVDLTRLGGATVTPEQWYAGLLMETGRALGLRPEAASFLKENDGVGPAQRFFAFLQELALAKLGTSVVILIDEIDAVRSLPFPTDELFAGLRQLHNGRSTDPDLRRLTVCLLGAALPSDLIRDPRVTPFNVGRRIELRDFTSEEARPFANQVGPEALNRVLHWTGGHPFLTQSLCASLTPPRGEGQGWGSAKAVDLLVGERYLGARARDTDTNLADVANRLLGNGDPSVGEKERADTLSLYERALRNKPVADDEANPSAARIKMSGVARVENGLLKPRNRIYAQAFDRKWVRDSMPGQELRRQRKAFWQGVLRTGGVAMAIVAVISTLAVVAVLNAQRARLLELQARREAYVATMRNMAPLRDQNNLFLIDAALQRVAKDPWRGWEWRYWNRVAHRANHVIPIGESATGWYQLSPDGKYGITMNSSSTYLVDNRRFVELARFPRRPGGSFQAYWMRDSRRFVMCEASGVVSIYDAVLRRKVRSGHVPELSVLAAGLCTLPGDRLAIGITRDQRLCLFDLQRLRTSPFPGLKGLPSSDGVFSGTVSPDGRTFYGIANGGRLFVCDLKSRTCREIAGTPAANYLALSGSGNVLAIGAGDGTVLTFRTSDLKPLARRRVFGTPAVFLQLSWDGQRIVATARNRDCVLLTAKEGTLDEDQRFPESNSGVVLPNGKTLVTAYWALRFYDVDAEPETPTATLPTGIHYGGISNAGLLVAFDGDGKGYWTRNLLQPAQPPARGAFFGASDPDSGLMAVRHTGDIRDVRTGALVRKVRLRDGEIANGIAVSPGRDLVALLTSQNLLLVPIDSRKPIRPLNLSDPTDNVRFSKDGRRLAVSHLSGDVELIDPATGRADWSDRQPRLLHHFFRFSNDGSRLAAVGDSDGGEVWDVKTGRRLYSLIGHSQTVRCVDWSPDGSRLATGSDDRSIHLWDASNGQDLGIVGRHDAPVQDVRFLSGGRTVASFGMEGVAKLWLTESRR